MLGHRQLADVVQQRGRLERLRIEVRHLHPPRQHRRVVAHPIEMARAGAVLRLNRPRQHLGALTMQLARLGHPPLLVGDPAQIDAVGPIRQHQRHERERRLPVSGALGQLDRQAGGQAADEIAGDAPQEVVVPDAEDRAARGQPERRRDGDRVDQEVGQHRREQRLEVRLGCPGRRPASDTSGRRSAP